ncbi:sulfatase family protein [Paenibacillus soyae]|jgi:arylsulfatase A-like enzyme|uniref:Sulfatase n=1 Tax=Paenibacillus soyae TaxID=2969249 RepID=A0A9X2MS85_9BACL|nr:sulfatase [Paenibacillus soyae]MCR2804796.1 sulfatase [Paenibacillus soyae]
MTGSHDRPNLLFIMSDDHAANAISAYGSRLAEVCATPHIDRLAKEGALFRNFFCTNAICTPSRATILTGLYSHHNGVKTLSDSLSTELETYPRRMQEAGYETAVIGKWHLHSEPQGFHHYDVLSGQGTYWNPSFMRSGFDWSSISNVHDVSTGTTHAGYVTDIITDKCLEWLESRNSSKPFMLHCHHKAPHDDFEYHPRYENLFDGIDIPEPDSLWENRQHRSVGSRDFGTSVSERNPKRNAVLRQSDPSYPTGPLEIAGLDAEERTKAAYQKYLKDYLRVVKGIDDNVGRLLDYLDQSGQLEHTIVIYTSDQGMFLGEHDYIDKRWIYEEALQMPFLIRYPKEIEPGTVMESLVSNIDIGPTLLDYANTDYSCKVDGSSFRGLLNGSQMEWKDAIYYRYWMHLTHHDNPAHFGMRTREYKLIFFYGLPLDASGALDEETPASWEFYDLRQDPYEMNNVYEHPEYKELIEEARQKLFAIKQSAGDDDSAYPELLERIALSLHS